jgi:hypothetical protein
MRKVLLQYWEESERGWGVRPDGASLHINENELKDYISSIYKDREPNKVPHEYDRYIGSPIEIEVADDLYNLVESKSQRLTQYQLNNLMKLEDIKL